MPVYEVGEHEGTHFFAMQLIEGRSLDRLIEELKKLRRSDQQKSESDAESQLAGLVQAFMNSSGMDESASRTRSPSSSSMTAGQDTILSSTSVGGQTVSSVDSQVCFYRNVARVGARIADALHYAHERGILHRDVKPSNLLVDRTGQVWLADFGLAKAEGSDALTATGDAVGTLRYMGPERFRGWSDPRSDVYSLGATIYELLALRPVYRDGDRAQLIEKIFHDAPRPLRRVDSSIPRSLETIVLKTLDKDPERRYSSALGLAEDLRRFVENRPIAARRAMLVERTWLWCRRNRWVAGLGAAVILTLTIGVLVSSSMYFKTRELADSVADEKRIAESHLKDARVDEARLLRGVRRVGQRVRGLEALIEAAEFGVTDEIRSEAFNTLCLVDLRPVGKFFNLDARDSWNVDEANETFVHVRVRDDGEADVEIGDVSSGDVRHSIRVPHSATTAHLSPSAQSVVLAQPYSFVDLWNLKGLRPTRVARLGSRGEACQFFRNDRGAVVVAAIERQDPTRLREYVVATGSLIRELRLPTPASYFSPSPDGRWLAIAGYDHRVHVIERSSGRTIDVLNFDVRVGSLAWHESERKLAAAAVPGGDISIWDLEKSQIVNRLRGGHREHIVTLEFQPGGSLLASWDWGNHLCLWNYRSEQLVLKDTARLVGRFTPDGKRCAVVASRNGQVHVIINDGKLRMLSAGADAAALFQAFSADDRYLAVGTDDGLNLYEVVSGRELGRLEIGKTEYIAFLPDGQSLISSGPAGIHQWPLNVGGESPQSDINGAEIGPPRLIFETGPSGFFCCLNPDGTSIAVRKNGRVHIVSVAGDSPVRTLEFFPAAGHSFDFSHDGRWLVGSNWNGVDIPIWDLETGKIHRVLGASGGASGVFSADGRFLVAIETTRCRVFTPADWQVAWQTAEGGLGVALDPQARYFALGVKPHHVQIFSFDGTRLARFESESGLTAFSSDGAFLVGHQYSSSNVYLWNIGEIRAELADLGLDWSFPSIRATSTTSTPLHEFTIDLGRLAGKFDGKSRETRAGAGLRVQPDDPGLLLDRGRARLDLRLWQEAESDLTRALEFGLRENQALAYLCRAWCRSGLRRYEEASADCSRALETSVQGHPEITAEAHYLSGLFAFWLNRYSGAAEHLTTFLAVDFTRPLRACRETREDSRHSASYHLGVAYFRAGEFEKTITGFSAPIFDRDRDAIRHRARAFKQLGRLKESLAAYVRLQQLFPDTSLANNDLAWFYVTARGEFRQPEKALPLIERAIALEKTPEAHLLNTRGVVKYRLGDFEGAIADLRGSRRISKKISVYDELFLAMCHARRGNRKESRSHFECAVDGWQSMPGDLNRGNILERDEFLREAKTTLEQAGVSTASP